MIPVNGSGALVADRAGGLSADHVALGIPHEADQLAFAEFREVDAVVADDIDGEHFDCCVAREGEGGRFGSTQVADGKGGGEGSGLSDGVARNVAVLVGDEGGGVLEVDLDGVEAGAVVAQCQRSRFGLLPEVWMEAGLLLPEKLK
jgi:hypothetical protein